jgi:excinuclease ABC subunit C
MLSVNDLPLINDPPQLKRVLGEIPLTPGVYLMGDRHGEILYIGKSKQLRNRVRSYFREGERSSHRISLMVKQVTNIEFIVTDTEAEALALEANLIKKHQPRFNVLLKDDKKYPYVCITWSEDYPRIFITRKRKLGKASDRYYGPYVDSRLLRTTLQIIQQIFPLRQRSQPLFKDRPCLNYDIGKCPGVCQGLISVENYRQIMHKVAMIFQGRTNELIENLTEQMLAEAEALNFEKAANIRDQINSLKSLHSDQKVSLPDDRIARDIFALAHNQKLASVQLFQIRAGKLINRLGFTAEIPAQGEITDTDLGLILQKVLESHYQTVDAVEIPPEIILQYALPDQDFINDWLSAKKSKKIEIVIPQKQMKASLIEMVAKNAEYELIRQQQLSDRQYLALEDLANILNLPTIPHRLEGYDISHIQGSNAVASRVVFIDGVPAPAQYRHYRIKNPTVQIGHSDDFASMAEVIERRFRDYQPTDADHPDVIMIDGGKGQLSAVMTVLEAMNISENFTVIGLAKKQEEIFLPGQSKPLATDPEQPGVQLLRQLRNEAHRFAVSFHRQQRTKSMVRSHLDEIPGLGLNKQKLLLGQFHSIDYVRMATHEQLMTVPGIGPKLAKQIYDYFHPPAN